MGGTINIVLAVDVIAALSSRTLKGSLHMMDDGPRPGENQGTEHLITYCWPGWQINWTIRQIDLQTPAVIKDIRFMRFGGPVRTAADASILVWSGIVPASLIPGQLYRYGIAVEMARGINSILSIETPALVVPLAV